MTTVDTLSLCPPPPDTWYVAPDGNDRWTGRRAEARRGDGPFATLDRALAAVRAHKAAAGGKLPRPARIVMRGGRYELARPVVLTAADSGWIVPSTRAHFEPDRTLTIEAMPGETPVLSGGRRIAGWRPARFNGVEAWAVRLPEVRAGDWTFTQLWVNGRRAPRSRWPRRGEFRLPALPPGARDRDARRLRFAEGQIRAWRNIEDVEFVGLVCWTEVRLPLDRIDERRRLAWLKFAPHRALADGESGAPFWIENLAEQFGRPGEWYLDRPSGMLYYRPRAGEHPDEIEVIAPRLGELMRFDGRPYRRFWVDMPALHAAAAKAGQRPPSEDPFAGPSGMLEQIVLRGLTFAHTEWQPAHERERADGTQSAAHLPGAIRLRGARLIRLENCTVHHMGTHAVELTDGCRDVAISHCRLHDLAAGGVKIWHGCRWIAVEDCEIYDGGRRHHRACGILIGNSPGNRILRNHIHHFDYTGVSVGWTWGYADCDCGGNVIERNHIHHIGRGVLSDLGAIYTLGLQPGARIRFNRLHDVTHRDYGSYGIYLDEGSSDMLVEGNLVYRIRGSSFFLHGGAHVLVRGNFFCGGEESVVARADTEPHDAMTVEGNVIAGRGVPAHSGDWTHRAGAMERNLYWDFARRPVRVGPWTLAQWQALGMDAHSIAADPRFVDPVRDDYRLRPDSPAHRLGIRFPDEALAAGPAPVRPSRRPHSTGPVQRFLVSAPIAGAGRLAHVSHPPPLTARRFTAREFPNGFANVHADLIAGPDPYIWLACPLRAARTVAVDISLGYDGPVRLWLDGRLLFADPRGTNPCTVGKAMVPARLAAGRHRLMIALGSNSGRAWGIMLNVIQRGNP